jgi:hypothetical protein
VIASDGVHATLATSNPFLVADNAPKVVIDGPADGAVLSGLQDVAMAAAAFDPDDGDGDVDLVMQMHFETQETGIEPGDDRACLVGRTYDGDDLAGCDQIVAR